MKIQPDKCGGALARTAGPDQERYYPTVMARMIGAGSLTGAAEISFMADGFAWKWAVECAQ